MSKKEHYRHMLPHYQQPGQAYFVTWCLKDAVPPKALKRYTQKLEELKNEIETAIKQSKESQFIHLLQQEHRTIRRKYMKAFDDLLALQTNPAINLSETRCTDIIAEALWFFEGKRITNYAYCIMPNHVHWVFLTWEKDENRNPVYLQDIMHSIKRHTANRINKLLNRKGVLWQKESFDVTIRDVKHLYHAIEYTVNNPVTAKMVTTPQDWYGTFGCGGG